VLVPLRGAAHLGARHIAAAYVPPHTPRATAQSLARATAAPAGEDAAYLRAPLAIDGVLQARAGAGMPIAGQKVAAIVTPAPPQTTATPPPQATAPPTSTAEAEATPTPTAEAGAAAPIAGDKPVNPNAQIFAADAGGTQPTGNGANASDLTKPLYYEHVVRPGDTVSTIAARYGISETTVILNNPLITDKNALYVGQTLRIPTKDGILYDVHLGDTLSEIAARFSVDPSAIISLAENGVPNADQIREGQTILVVGAKPPPPPPPPPPPSPTPTPTPTPPPTAAPTAVRPTGTSAPPAPPSPPPVPVSSSGFIWPAHGPITQGFGMTDFAESGAYGGLGHPGIDIGQSYGLPIVAAKDGVVTFAGGNPCCGYGYYVDIDHGGGVMTRYGHMRSWPIVSIGQRVKQGQIIGYSGSTGYSTGPHVHFEIRINGVPQNPLNFLPPGGN